MSLEKMIPIHATTLLEAAQVAKKLGFVLHIEELGVRIAGEDFSHMIAWQELAQRHINVLITKMQRMADDETLRTRRLAKMLRMATKLYATAPGMPKDFLETSDFVKDVNKLLRSIDEQEVTR